MSLHTETLVIGGGPAGLTTGYMLAKAGRDVVVLERDATQVGGISRTVEYKGFLFDIGGHRFFSKAKEVVDLWNEILPDDFIERPRLSRIYYKGKTYAYPLKAFEACATSASSRAAFASPPISGPAPGRSRTRELPRMGPQPVRRAAVLDLLQDLHREGVGHVCDDISADWARRSASRGSTSAPRSATGSSARWGCTGRPPATAR